MIVTTNNPVVFTDGAGPYGADELHAPYFPALENHAAVHYSCNKWVAIATASGGRERMPTMDGRSRSDLPQRWNSRHN